MQDLFTTVTLPICGGLLVLAGLILAQARALRRNMTQMDTRLREDMRDLRGDMKDLRGEVRDLRQHVDTQNSDLRDRLGRIEGYLDLLREFFVGSGRGTAA